MKNLFSAILLALFVTQAYAGNTIRFATEPTYPPFEYIDENNQMTGFDIELAKALCKEIKAECSFSNQSFDSLIPSLKFRRFDAIISGMDITASRLEQVDFSNPYYENSAVFIAEKGKISGVDQLSKKTVGVQNGTTHQSYLINNFEKKGVKIRPYDSYQNALLDLTNGRIDAVFSDTAVAREWIISQDKKKFAIAGKEIKDPDYFGTGMGIAVRKNDPLRETLNKALEKVKLEGTYQKLLTKYFDPASNK